MISTLVNLLGGFYESNDFAKVETIAHSIHTAVPEDQVSLKFLGLAYYRTGRIKDAKRLFDRVQGLQKAKPDAVSEKTETGDSAVLAVSREATRRVPYLAQAWRDLGNALRETRSSGRAAQSFQNGCLA